MTEKRTRAIQKRAKAKVKAKKTKLMSVKNETKLVSVKNAGENEIQSFLDICCPSNLLPLTDDLYDKLVAIPDFSNMKKSDFDAFKKEGFFFNPSRNSFISPMISDFD